MNATVRNMRERMDTPGMIAWSPTTGEQSSADARDYWYLSDDDPLVDDNGEPMILAVINNAITEL